MAEQIRLRRPRKPTATTANSSSDPRNPHGSIPSIVQSTTCKSTISSLFLSTFTNSHNNSNSNPGSNHRSSSGNRTINSGHGNDNSGNRKMKGLNNSGLRGLGCTAQPEVAVPAVIRSSADWEERAGERKRSNNNSKKKKKKKERESVLEFQDVWCGPGIGFSGFAGDDLVASTRPVSGRGKIDVDKGHRRERPTYSSGQRVNLDQFADLDLDPAFEIPYFDSDVFEARYHHLHDLYPKGLSEIVMVQNGAFNGTRASGFDIYSELRLDTENMSYEELLELSDKIGYVNTGLKEDQMGHCVMKAKISTLDKLSPVADKADAKCSICQEEYETGDDTGRLECGHVYHLQCIKQWLAQKNACPVCKATASSQ